LKLMSQDLIQCIFGNWTILVCFCIKWELGEKCLALVLPGLKMRKS